MQEKIYLFLTPSINGIGGAELYVRAKALWLQDNGWDVCIVGAKDGVSTLGFGDAFFFWCPDLVIKPACAGKNRMHRVLGRLNRIVRGYSKVHIESSLIRFAGWGELLAAETGGAHQIFHLAEGVPVLDEWERALLRKKAAANEFACIKEHYFLEVFGTSKIPDTNLEESRVLTAFQGNPVEDVPYDLGSIPEADYYIGCISRLNKPYVAQVFKAVSSFAKKHGDKRVAFIVVGESRNPITAVRLKVLLLGRLNVITRFTGPLAPLPKCLVSKFDVALEKAGTIFPVARVGVPTIAYSHVDDACMGVIGFDCDKTLSGGESASLNAENLLEDILVEGKYSGDYRYDLGEYEQPNYESHFKYLSRTTDPGSQCQCILEANFTVRSLFSSYFSYINSRANHLAVRMLRK